MLEESYVASHLANLSKPSEAESKLGCAPIVPSEFLTGYIHTNGSLAMAEHKARLLRLGGEA